MPEFVWPDIVPAGQRNIKSSSSMLRKNLGSVTLSAPDGSIIDIFDDDFEDELTRLSLLCAACGTMSGPRNILHAGLIVAAAVNSPDTVKPEGKYSGYNIQICWSSDSKLDITCSVEHLMDLTFLLAKIIVDSEESGGFNISARTRKVESVPEFDPAMAIRRR